MNNFQSYKIVQNKKKKIVKKKFKNWTILYRVFKVKINSSKKIKKICNKIQIKKNKNFQKHKICSNKPNLNYNKNNKNIKICKKVQKILKLKLNKKLQ